MKRAIVIGASSGMGREVTRLLLKDGWKVGVAARREDRLRELWREWPDRVEVMPIDVTSDEAPQRLLELVGRVNETGLQSKSDETAGSGLDLFFYASGSGKQNLGLETEIELSTVELNAKGFTRMVDTTFGYMAEHGGGHIAVISSIAGTKGLGSAPSYSATKAFQATYIQSLEQLAHIRRLPIRFTDIRPGFVDTALLDGPAKYPMLMKPDVVARRIVRAVMRRRHVKIIDWRYGIMVFFWRLIPNWLWRNLRIVTKDK
ncbi:MAG: SDR family NAD(P)-dependent oxidoreductase [Bacteroidales bacterium]|nr:SDR family NAD(P)-dependent oxidoreductase [Bacteroidales bacterium]